MVLGFFKKRKALKRGQEFAATISKRAEDHITHRVQPAAVKFIDVFRDRLKTVYDDPQHDPRLVCDVEYDVFKENLGEFLGEMRAELSIRLYRYDDAIRELKLQEVCDNYIRKRISEIQSEMLAEAATLVFVTRAEIEVARPTPG